MTWSSATSDRPVTSRSSGRMRIRRSVPCSVSKPVEYLDTRGTYEGQGRRKLLGLRVDGDRAPVHGDRVSKDGREVGFVTSVAWSPSLGGVIALATLRVDAVTSHGVLFIDRGGWAFRAR